MKVTFIPGRDVNSDLGVVNAARVSLHKKSMWEYGYSSGAIGVEVYRHLSDADTKLIQYLAKYNHWTPFAHPRLYFEVTWKSTEHELRFYRSYNPAGFAMQLKKQTPEKRVDYIKGSLLGWLYNASCLPVEQSEYVYDICNKYYPTSSKAHFIQETEPFLYGTNIIEMSEDYVIAKKLWDIACATLLVKVPIFVARQIRTSMVGFSYSDLYVESESFVFNEVSRRYVDEVPEFYQIGDWRVREGKKVKQGSTGVADVKTMQVLDQVYNRTMTEAELSYQRGRELHIAPEQLRALLPQAMYTEFYMTGTLRRWAQFLHLRLQPDVQEETRDIASSIACVLCGQFPKWGEAYEIQKLL